jgi:hypothetical protein
MANLIRLVCPALPGPLDGGELGLERGPVVALGDGGPQCLDLVVQQLLRLGAREIGAGEKLGSIGRPRGQQGAENEEGLPAIVAGAGPGQGAALAAREPVIEERLPAQGLTALGEGAKGGVGQIDVGLGSGARQPKAADHGGGQLGPIGGSEAVHRLHQRLGLAHGGERAGQLAQVPEHRLWLAPEAVESGAVKIGGHEIGIVARQEAIGPVVEAFAGDVHVVGVEHPMHEAGRHPAGGEARGAGHHRGQKGGGRIVGALELGIVGADHVAEEGADQIGPLQRRVTLKCAKADVAPG